MLMPLLSQMEGRTGLLAGLARSGAIRAAERPATWAAWWGAPVLWAAGLAAARRTLAGGGAGVERPRARQGY